MTTPSAPDSSARSSSSADAVLTRAIMIWLPSKPISIWMRSSATRDHLREDAVDRIRMDERDLEAEHPLPRLGVDQLGPLRGELGERGPDVRDLVGHVVHPRPAVGEELPDRGLLAEGGQELDAPVADEHGRRLD